MAGRAKSHEHQGKLEIRATRTSKARQPAKRIPAISRASVTAHALDTFGSSKKAEHWMNRPNPLFEGKTPIQVMKTDIASVEAELVRIDHGIYM